LLDVGAGWRVAAGAHHVVEYLLAPPTVPLPRTAAHCPGVLLWRERIVPLLDLARLLPGPPAPVPARERAVILAYQDAPGAPLRYGALRVQAAPAEVWASDEHACPLPDEPAELRQLSRSCFRHLERPVAVLDVARLFARPLAWVAARAAADPEDAAGAVAAPLATGALPNEPLVAPSPLPTPVPAVPAVDGVGAPLEAEGAAPAGVPAVDVARPELCVPTPVSSEHAPSAPPAEAPPPDDAGRVPSPAIEVRDTHDELAAVATASPASPAVRSRSRSPSAFGDSVARFRALQGRHPATRRRSRWPALAVAGVVLAVVAGLLVMGLAQRWLAPDVPSRAAPTVRDVAPQEVAPYTAPGAPTRPPS
jgi:chemotaxis signal transduction protein